MILSYVIPSRYLHVELCSKYIRIFMTTDVKGYPTLDDSFLHSILTPDIIEGVKNGLITSESRLHNIKITPKGITFLTVIYNKELTPDQKIKLFLNESS